MNDHLHGRIDTYCYMVKNGKPAALVSVQVRYEQEVIKYIKTYDLKTLSENLSEGWKTIWIYKYPHILEVIKALPHGEPKIVYDHWVLGKLFGYSEDSIQEFLSRSS